MKKSFLTATILIVSYYSYGQNTYPWPSSGNVGIGTTTPAGKLTVKTTGASLEFDTGETGGSMLSYDRTTNTYKKLVMRGSAFGFYPSDAEKFTIDGSGNVGIGTSDPTSLLHIRGENPALGTFLVLDDQSITNRTGVRLRFQSNQIAHWNIGIPANIDAFTINGWGGNSNPEYFRINIDGNVGIGTTTPDSKLAVNGTIHSKEIKIDMANWPDYVFKPDYDLPSLTAVKTYINKNRRLPAMPSAQDVEKNGLNLGELNKILTRKVEELTLYMIDKDNEIREQRGENQSQQKQIDVLQHQVAELLKLK